MRLKQYQKDRIVSTLTAVTFKDRVARKVAEENRLAMRVLETQTTPAERAAMATLPAKFFNTKTYTYAYVSHEGRSNQQLQLHFAEDVAVPRFIDKLPVVITDPDLLAEINHFLESNKALSEERNAFEKQTQGVVNSFSTSQKLIEAWPVVAEIMPTDYFAEPAKPQLPTTKINELDALVQGARPFETETTAA